MVTFILCTSTDFISSWGLTSTETSYDLLRMGDEVWDGGRGLGWRTRSGMGDIQSIKSETLARNVFRPVKTWPTITRTIDIKVVHTSVLCNLLFQPLQKEQEITKTVSPYKNNKQTNKQTNNNNNRNNKQTNKQTATTTTETTNKQTKQKATTTTATTTKKHKKRKLLRATEAKGSLFQPLQGTGSDKDNVHENNCRYHPTRAQHHVPVNTAPELVLLQVCVFINIYTAQKTGMKMQTTYRLSNRHHSPK